VNGNQEDQLTKTEHDFLVLLAEHHAAGNGVNEAMRAINPTMGWRTNDGFRNKIYLVAKKLGVHPTGGFLETAQAVAASAVSRGYQDEIYYFMDEGENDVPNRTPVLPVKEA
jgi:hypothetical protein